MICRKNTLSFRPKGRVTARSGEIYLKTDLSIPLRSSRDDILTSFLQSNLSTKMKKAFTLIELVVAIGLMVMVISFSGLIFKVSIDGYRTTAANAEIMQKLRAITDQLNADFRGLRKDAPLLIWFCRVPVPNTFPQRYYRFDQIMFFADGDFQSTQLYRDKTFGPRIPFNTGTPIKGNVARIDYGLAQSHDPNTHNMTTLLWNPRDIAERHRILGCRRHILTADAELAQWPDVDYGTKTLTYFNDSLNQRYEHDNLSLAQWKTIDGVFYNNPTNDPTNANANAPLVASCFQLPYVDTADPNTYHKLVCEGVGSFAVQWENRDTVDGVLRWFPSNNPYADYGVIVSHFDMMPDPVINWFGVYFNVPSPKISSTLGWYSIGEVQYRKSIANESRSFHPEFYPDALKFTFTLYDSKGIIKEGRTFTHIVYLID